MVAPGQHHARMLTPISGPATFWRNVPAFVRTTEDRSGDRLPCDDSQPARGCVWYSSSSDSAPKLQPATSIAVVAVAAVRRGPLPWQVNGSSMADGSVRRAFDHGCCL